MSRVKEFLKLENGYDGSPDIHEMTRRFALEMESGLTGRESSLPMIPSFLGDDFLVTAGETVVAVDAGGTNLRVSRITFTKDGEPVIEETRKYRMPGSESAIDSDTFFEILAGYLVDLLDGVKKLGFCFSYEVEIQPDLDGKILSLSKEVCVTGCENKMIGQELGKALLRQGAGEVPKITVLNDTTACLLGGRLLCKEREYGDYIGFVLGTGTNLCYYEDNAGITKVPFGLLGKGRSIINVESACFDKMPVGNVDETFFMTTKQPMEHRLEKLVSGQYLGPLFLHYVSRAADCGVFEDETRTEIKKLGQVSTAQLNAFLEGEDKDGGLSGACAGRERDREAFVELADYLLERAAALSVASIAACLERGGEEQKSAGPVLVTAEGTTFHRCRQLHHKILNCSKLLTGSGACRNLDFVSPENSVICGTALAAVHTKN
ncbi:MAG: hypothetical protein KHZ58_10120 [Hungatella hathewayi]|nr:hypothetical protein [Hungatella hathewayi]